MTALEKDKKLVAFLASSLLKLDDFKGKSQDANDYAVQVIATLRTTAESNEDFKDRAMGIIANVKNLNGEFTRFHITPTDLATMDATDMLSQLQKREQEKIDRKRAREQTLFDKTGMLCKTCGLVRRDRLNINELALDSEENGTQFDYNFDNVCTCSQTSSSSSTDSDSDGDVDDAEVSSTSGDTEARKAKEHRKELQASQAASASRPP